MDLGGVFFGSRVPKSEANLQTSLWYTLGTADPFEIEEAGICAVGVSSALKDG